MSFFTIIADDRETNGANPYFDKFIINDNAAYTKKPKNAGGGTVKLCIGRVTTGDYNIVLSDPSGDPKKQIVAMIIERKTWKDLAASFKDGRSQTQHKEMLSVQSRTNCIIMYIIEGRISYDKETKVGRIPFANLDAKRRHLLLRGHALIQTKDQEHTAEMIVNLARDVWRMHQSGEIVFGLKPLTVDSYENELAVLNEKYKKVLESKVVTKPEKPKEKLPMIQLNKNVDEQNIQNNELPENVILDELDMEELDAQVEKHEVNGDAELVSNLALLEVHSDSTVIPEILTERKIRSDSDIVERMWIAIPGVSVKSAPILIENYRISDLVSANDVQYRNYLKEIAELTYPSGRRFGDDMAKKVMKIAYAGKGVSTLDDLKNISANILAEIPGVSKDTAKAILTKYSLRDICTGKVGEDELADLKKSATRKVGRGVAEKIIEALQ